MVKGIVEKLRRILEVVTGKKDPDWAAESNEALPAEDAIRWAVTANPEPSGAPPKIFARPDETGYVIEVPIYVTNVGDTTSEHFFLKLHVGPPYELRWYLLPRGETLLRGTVSPLSTPDERWEQVGFRNVAGLDPQRPERVGTIVLASNVFEAAPKILWKVHSAESEFPPGDDFGELCVTVSVPRLFG